MKKVKMVSGYLIVQFNARELKANEGTALGAFGIIDPELYTGHLDVDRGAMEYDDAGTLEEAISLAEGLRADADKADSVEEPPAHALPDTAAPATAIEAALNENRERLHAQAVAVLAEQESLARSYRHPDNVLEVLHEAHGLADWLESVNIITAEECRHWGDHLASLYMERSREPARSCLSHAPDQCQHNPEVFALGVALEAGCPDNDCTIYLKTFRMARSVDEQAERVTGRAREVLTREVQRLYHNLELMYALNHAVIIQRHKLEARTALGKTEIAPELTEAGLKGAVVRICERFPYLAQEVHDTGQFIHSVSGMKAAETLLTASELWTMAGLAGRSAVG